MHDTYPFTIYPDPQNPTITYQVFETSASFYRSALQRQWTPDMLPSQWLVVFSERQTQGVGSHNRRWLTDGVNFHVNLLFFTDHVWPFSQFTAWIACQHLASETGQSFQLKWPNDICFRTQKIGGVISTVRNYCAQRHWVIIGIGINYNDIDFTAIDQPATSVQRVMRRSGFEQAELLTSVQHFARLWVQSFLHYQTVGLAQFYGDCAPHWCYWHQAITIFDEDQRRWLKGCFQGVTLDGRLQLQRTDGTTVLVTNGTGLRLDTDEASTI